MKFEEMVQKAINAKAKASSRFSTMIRDLDAHYSKSHHFSHATLAKVQTQGFNIKKSKPKEFRPKNPKLVKGKTSTLFHSKSTKPQKTFYIDKKKEYLKKKRDQKNNIPAIADNANVIKRGKKKQNNWDNKRYYNCQKKCHFSKNYLETPKN